MGARKEYTEGHTYYHSVAKSLRYEFPQETRPFPVPEPLWAIREVKPLGRRHFDVILASEFRLPGGTTASNVEEIKAQKRLGLRAGLFHMAHYDYLGRAEPADPRIRELKEAELTLARLMSDADYRQKLGHQGYREVMGYHTYRQRVETIYQKTGLQARATEPDPKVSIVTASNRPGNIKNILANFTRQNYPNLELILILNSDSYTIEQVRSKFGERQNVQVHQLPEACTLGKCLNLGVEKMTGEYFAKMDDDDIYLANYVSDLALTFKYHRAGVAGKRSVYAFMEDTGDFILRFPEQEHRYITLLTGATIFAKRAVFEKVRFPELHGSGTDTRFLEATQAAGFRLYSADRYNYIVFRAKSLDDHIWRIGAEEFARNSIPVAKGLRTDIAEC